MDNEEQKKVQAIVSKAMRELHEAGVEAVQILASWGDGTGTRTVCHGFGNWFARKGMAMEFLEKDRANITADATANALNDEEEE